MHIPSSRVLAFSVVLLAFLASLSINAAAETKYVIRKRICDIGDSSCAQWAAPADEGGEEENHAPAFTSVAQTEATENEAYAYHITASDADGDALAITSNDLSGSGWISFSDHGNGTATLEGTPTSGDTFPMTVVLTVSDGTATATQSFQISLNNILPVWSSPAAGSLGTFTVGEAIADITLVATDADTVTYSLASGSLPNGLSVSGDTLTGTPSESGSFSFALRATDTDGGFSDRSFSLTVEAAPLVAEGTTCYSIKLDDPSTADGIYVLDPDGVGGVDPFEAYCDMTTDGGGWTLAVRGNPNVTYNIDDHDVMDIMYWNTPTGVASGTEAYSMGADAYATLLNASGDKIQVGISGQATDGGTDWEVGVFDSSSFIPDRMLQLTSICYTAIIPADSFKLDNGVRAAKGSWSGYYCHNAERSTAYQFVSLSYGRWYLLPNGLYRNNTFSAAIANAWIRPHIPSGSASVPAGLTCKSIHDANPTYPSGIYWVDPDGVGTGIDSIQAWCDMTGDLAGTPGDGGWTLFVNDPGADYDVPFSAVTNTWIGDLAQRKGMLSLQASAMSAFLMDGRVRFRLDGGAWTETTFAYNPTYSRFETPITMNCVSPLILVNSCSGGWAYGFSSGVGSTCGCKSLTNDNLCQPSVSTGTAGTGDYNYSNGSGCWNIPAYGPISGEAWVR